MVREAQEAQQKMNLEDRRERQNGEHTARSVNSADTEIQDLDSTMLANDGSQLPLRAANAASDISLGAAETMLRKGEQEDANMERAIQEPLTVQEDASKLYRQGQDHQAGQTNLRPAEATSAAEAHRRTSVGGWDSNLDLYHEDERERREFEAISERAAAMAGGSLDRQQPPAYDPWHLAGTSRSEFEAEQKGRQREKTTEEKTEEEIVMEYIKKQSLLEVHHKNKGKDRRSAVEDEDDEDLQKVLKLSMQEHANRYGETAGI